MIVERYRPAFFSGFDDERAIVGSFDELMDLAWVKLWNEIDGFYRFSMADNKLMAELNKGTKWFVVAFLIGCDISSITNKLPVWKLVKKEDLI